MIWPLFWTITLALLAAFFVAWFSVWAAQQARDWQRARATSIGKINNESKG